MDDQRLLLTSLEAALALGYRSVRPIAKLVADGEIMRVRLPGGAPRITAESVRALIRRTTAPPLSVVTARAASAFVQNKLAADRRRAARATTSAKTP